MNQLLQILFFPVLFVFFQACSPSPKAVVESSAHVYGNCDKCKATIEKSAKINGVMEAVWSPESKLLNMKIDTTVTTRDAVLKAVAAGGYDNEVYRGDDYAYDKLPECCQYERKDHQ